jgi:hypothetical protein
MANKPWTKSEEYLLIQLRGEKTDEEIAHMLGRTAKAVQSKAGHLRVAKERNGKNKSSTLCWDCAKATGGCSWSKNHLPMKGWTATATQVNQTFRKGGDPTAVSSYIVHKCPEFVYG